MTSNDLFSTMKKHSPSSFRTRSITPLPEQARPTSLDEIEGQEHLTGPGQKLRVLANSKMPTSLVLHGPAGTGKTSLARILAQSWNCHFEAMNATTDGISRLREIMTLAAKRKNDGQTPIVLFLDEIGRWSTTQQETLLTVEDGSLFIIAATTDNIGFSIAKGLLSRLEKYRLKPLSDDALKSIATRLASKIGLPAVAEPDALDYMIRKSGGDGRSFIMIVNAALRATSFQKPATMIEARHQGEESVQTHDREEDHHYELLSAIQKSIRGSDPQATFLYIAKALDGGEKQEVLLRRLMIIATEDIGMADPQAAILVSSLMQARMHTGDGDGALLIYMAAAYLATAPKSNAAYMAGKMALSFVQNHPNIRPPKKIINAPTTIMAEEGFRQGYIYDHDIPGGVSGDDFMPDEFQGEKRPTFYTPTDRGHEGALSETIKNLEKTRRQKNDT